MDAALAYTAMTLQSPFMQQYEGKVWDEVGGQDALGDGPLHRAYEANDGWFFLGALETEVARLDAVEGLSGVGKFKDSDLAHALEERFQANTVDTWVVRLTAAELGAHRVVTHPSELMDDPWVLDHGLSITRQHQEIGLVTTCGPAPRLSRTPVTPGRPAPKPGADAHEILDEIGMGHRFGDLVDQGVVRLDGVAAG